MLKWSISAFGALQYTQKTKSRTFQIEDEYRQKVEVLKAKGDGLFKPFSVKGYLSRGSLSDGLDRVLFAAASICLEPQAV